jgi:hypothetical protein
MRRYIKNLLGVSFMLTMGIWANLAFWILILAIVISD